MRSGKYSIVIMVLLVYLIALSGCGGGSGGAPGSTGSEDTGISIKSVSATNKDVGNLDTAIHLCPPDFTEIEPGLFMDYATLTIDAGKVNPNVVSNPFPASVEMCTITYRKANEDPASPIIESLTIYPNCTLVDTETSSTKNSCSFTLSDIQRKVKWWTDISGGLNLPAEYPTHYVAQYNCRYVNNFGRSGYFVVEYDVWLADWNLCGA